MNKNRLALGSPELQGVRHAPPTGAQGETLIEKRQKQSKEIIDWL